MKFSSFFFFWNSWGQCSFTVFCIIHVYLRLKKQTNLVFFKVPLYHPFRKSCNSIIMGSIRLFSSVYIILLNLYNSLMAQRIMCLALGFSLGNGKTEILTLDPWAPEPTILNVIWCSEFSLTYLLCFKETKISLYHVSSQHPHCVHLKSL